MCSVPLAFFLLLLLLAGRAAAVAPDAARQLLADRAWVSRQLALAPAPAPPPAACLAVVEPLRPGATVEGYELVERAALLGVCRQPVATAGSDSSPEDDEDEGEGEKSGRDGVLELAGPASGGDDHHHQQQPTSSVCALPLAPPRRESEGAGTQVAQTAAGGGAELADGPSLEYQCLLEDIALIYVNANYRLKTKFDAGSHGEVWKATRRAESDASDEHFVLKRLFLELGEHMVHMGLREAHFGRLLAAEPHVTRFVEYFFRPPAALDAAAAAAAAAAPSPPQQPQELWLVFYDEGMSLRHYLYAKREAAAHAGVIFEPSAFWRRLRTDARGERVFREILRQLLQGVAAVHARGITHRDIKPSNILVSLGDEPQSEPVVKLADFGSAVDDFTLRHLYARGHGPSQAEETREYQPPEVLFSDLGQPYDAAAPRAYDLWSVGVVFLEMLLGSPQVFQLSARARAKLDAKLRGKDDGTKRKSYLLHVLSREFCIFQPPPHQLRALWSTYAVAADGCSFGRFNLTVVARDPLRKGLEDPWGLDLLWKLLQWHPAQRIPAARALEHAFFRGAYVCRKSGRRFATREELRVHERFLAAQEARDHEMALVVRERYELPRAFACPHCGRSFSTVASCEQHLVARKHDAAARTRFCAFDALALEAAVEAETAAFLSQQQHQQRESPVGGVGGGVGVALFQGRRKYMEDLLVAAADPQLGFELYAVSDGHLGTRAAEFVVANLLRILSANLAASLAASGAEPPTPAEREFAERAALRQTFLELHGGFVASAESAGERHDFSGCTLTVVLYFRDQRRLVSANVGDSRAVALVGEDEVVPLTTDHWPNAAMERARIESSGGFVSFAGLWRVVGQLAVSRSIGDQHLRQFVSAEPSIVHVAVPPAAAAAAGAVLVVASDGLWETMANGDVLRFVQERRAADLDATARSLLVEGYVRGSQDNLALVLVAL